MNGGSSPKKGTTTSGISVNKQSNIDDYNVTGTVTLSRKSMGMGKPSSDAQPAKTAPPPPSEISKMAYSVATERDVLCPKCKDKYDITKQYFNTVTQCLNCKIYFVIRPPGTPPYRPAASTSAARSNVPPAPRQSSIPPKQRSTTSGIQVDNESNKDMGVTGTVLLSRSGMSMMQRRRGEKRKAQQQRPSAPSQQPVAPVADGSIYSVATDRDIGCPKCQERFEISPEFYNAVAECPDCGCEFLIKPPGTPPSPSQARPSKPNIPRQAAAPNRPPQARPAAPAAPPPARTTNTHRVPVASPATKQPLPPTQEPVIAPQADNTGDKKAIDPLVIGLFVAVVLLLVAIIIILLVVK